MTGAERIESLRAKHSRLEIEIDQEAHRPLPDNVQLAALKREKLRIKEDIPVQDILTHIIQKKKKHSNRKIPK